MLSLLRAHRTLVLGLIALGFLVVSAVYSFGVEPAQIINFLLVCLLLLVTIMVIALPFGLLLRWIARKRDDSSNS